MATWALANAIYRRTQYAVEIAKWKAPPGTDVTTIALERPPPA